MEKYFQRKRPSSVEESGESSLSPNAQRLLMPTENSLEFNCEDLISDPGLRPPISSYNVNDRDAVRRAYLQKNACQPRGHIFPWTQYRTKRRRFNVSWFDEYQWLEYSVEKDSAFCLYCYVFPDFDQDLAFISRGFSCWKEKNRLDGHVGDHSSAHNTARRKCEVLMKEKQHIRVNLAKQSELARNDYHIRLNASIDCSRFLLKQGLAFRGHDESEDSKNRGNFLELLSFLAEHNSEIDNVVLKNAPENLKLTAPKIQKDIINTLACEVSENIVKEIGDDVFSVLIDESRDVSIKEQMAVVLRYVNMDGKIIERFLGLVHVSSTTALSLKQALDDIFCRFGLSISNLRGQGYDGASNMQGEFNGLKTLIMKENPFAFYIHCFAHQLQLVLVAVAENHRDVASLFEDVNAIMNTVGGSCKRYDTLRSNEVERIARELHECNIETGKGKNQELGIKRAGNTRWSSHYNTLTNMCIMFPSVVEVLRILRDDGEHAKIRALANSYFKSIQTYDFVFMLILMRNLLAITSLLSDSLQRKDQDIVNAINLVQVCKIQLNNLRNDDEEWESFLGEVSLLCERNFIKVVNMDEAFEEPGRPRRGKEKNKNIHHFRFEIFNTVIDLLLNELNDRFNETNTELLLCVACFDPRDNFAAFDKDRLIRLAQIYHNDFSIFEVDKLSRELNTYIIDVRQNQAFAKINGISGLYAKLIELRKEKVYVLVCRLLKLTLLLPVATASVERVFSAMNIIKSQLRNRGGDEFINDCLVTYIERDIAEEIDNKSIMERFQNMRPRRGTL